MPDDTHLSLRYFGGEADQGQMGYYDAASSIIAFGDLMGVFSQTLYGEKAYIQTTVKGVREGSFGIDFILHVGGMLASVLTGPASPKDIWQLFKQCVDAWRFLDGKPPKEVVRNGDQFGLTNIQGGKIRDGKIRDRFIFPPIQLRLEGQPRNPGQIYFPSHPRYP